MSKTVKVKNAASDSGWMLINESDFDKDKHELFEGEKNEVQKKAKRGRRKKAEVIEDAENTV